MVNRDLNSIVEIVHSSFPSKTLVDISDYEDEKHQTYKYLYENQCERIITQTEELYSLQIHIQNLERENSELQSKLEIQKSVNDKLKNMRVNIMEFAEKFKEQEIVVTNIKALDKELNEIVMDSDKRVSLANSISDRPGIYGDKRPSWFTPLQRELNKENAARRVANNTKQVLAERLYSLKEILRKLSKKDCDTSTMAMEFDQKRKMQIVNILESESSNYEKYIKYFLITPGLDKDFINTLNGAAEIGLDANVIIELLEQPEESFNKEIIEYYVSETHKGKEYNLKKELAEELVRGEWFVIADINGVAQKFQMVPIELLNDIKTKLDNMCNILTNMANEEVCANLAQTSSDIHQNVNDFYDESLEIESPLICFDDSMIET